MNKRIKNKIMKRAINKYDFGIVLSHKEYELIKQYIFLKEFDFSKFLDKCMDLLKKAWKFISDAFIKLGERIGNSINTLKFKSPQVTIDPKITTYYAGPNPND